MRLSARVGHWLLLAALPYPLHAQAPSAQDVPKSLLPFVQSFYDWYAHAGSSLEQALKDRSSSFQPTLRRALLADIKAQSKNPDDIVGLDVDPFLDAQDPCERYEVGAAHQTGHTYQVEIYGTCDGTRHATPDVVAELAYQHGAWVFVNFHYPRATGPEDLLGELKQLRAERQGSSFR